LRRQGALTAAAPPLITAVLKRLEADVAPLPPASILKRLAGTWWWASRCWEPACRGGKQGDCVLHVGVEKERTKSEESGEEGGRETACPIAPSAAAGDAERGLSGASGGGFSECGARGHTGSDQDGTVDYQGARERAEIIKRENRRELTRVQANSGKLFIFLLQ
jgi:hypothetical protein